MITEPWCVQPPSEPCSINSLRRQGGLVPGGSEGDAINCGEKKLWWCCLRHTDGLHLVRLRKRKAFNEQ